MIVDLLKHDLLTAEQEKELFECYKQSKSVEARNEIAAHNMRLIAHCIDRYGWRNHNISTDDLMHEGYLGLIRAIEKFNPEYGTKFSTYAHYWIRQAICRYISLHSRTMRIPVYKHDLYLKIEALRPLSDEEIIKKLGMSRKLFTWLMQHGPTTTSLDKPLDRPIFLDEDGDENTLYKFVYDENTEDYDDIRDIIFQELHSRLTPREEKIIRLRYGLDDGIAMTLKRIGKRFGVSRERIRQIIRVAEEKLSESEKLREWMEETRDE